MRVSDADWRPLEQWADPKLEAALRRAIEAKPAWKRLAQQRQLAVGLVDLSNPTSVRFAAVNGDSMMYAASLPKIGILLAAYEAFEDGSLEDTPEIQEELTAMIRVSSNAAATAMIDRLSLEKIEAVLTDKRYELYDQAHGGGIWVGKRFAKQGERIGDPLANISHAATASQVCRFYYLLATGRVISPERSREILDHLSHPGLNHKFVGILHRRAPRALLFRKSGTWQRWHSDSVLVWGPTWRQYILVGLVESESGETILRELVGSVEGVLKPPPPAVMH
jgi:beta-lactamase class A